MMSSFSTITLDGKTKPQSEASHTKKFEPNKNFLICVAYILIDEHVDAQTGRTKMWTVDPI